MGKNAIVGQSGGPTSVINASLAGVFESCKSRGADVVYGMCNGVAGLLEERVVDLSTLLTDDLDIELLKRTPSSFLGSCRYKLPDWHTDEAVYKKLFAILEKLNIGYFFYIGGNDSMDTIGKLADYGARIQSDIRFMGVPKTIDNDLMVTDHTPGYGSAAKYIGVVMKEIIRDATVYGTKYVTVVEIMGRNAGWLTAAAALAKGDDCEGVDMICLPEVPFNVDHFIEKVRVMQEKKPSIVIAVSEGVKLEDGRYVCELADDVHAVDAFGHKALTGTARFLANTVARSLDTKTRCIELSTLQRCAGNRTQSSAGHSGRQPTRREWAARRAPDNRAQTGRAPPRRGPRRSFFAQSTSLHPRQHQCQRRQTEHGAGEIMVQERTPRHQHPGDQLRAVQNQHARALAAAAPADLPPQQPDQRRQPGQPDDRPGHAHNAGLHAVGQVTVAVVPHRAQAQQPSVPAALKRVGRLQRRVVIEHRDLALPPIARLNVGSRHQYGK